MSKPKHINATAEGTEFELNLRQLLDITDDAMKALPDSTTVRVIFEPDDAAKLLISRIHHHQAETEFFADLMTAVRKQEDALSNESSNRVESSKP